MEVTPKTFARSELSRPPKIVRITDGARSPSPSTRPVIRSKVNSIAQTGSLKTRNTIITPRPRSPVRSPSPERLFREGSNINFLTPNSTSPKVHSTVHATTVRIPKLSTTNIFTSPVTQTHSRPRNASLSGKSSMSSLSSRGPMPKFGVTPNHSPTGRMSPTRQVTEDQRQLSVIRIKPKFSSKISRPLPSRSGSPPSRSSANGVRIAGQVSPERMGSPERWDYHSRKGSGTTNLSININHGTQYDENNKDKNVYVRPPLVALGHSPPASTVSFTSQSTSISSRLQSPISDAQLSTPEGTESRKDEIGSHVISLLAGNESELEVEESVKIAEEEEEEEYLAEELTPEEEQTAKSNRRTADLEIRNRSLLSINNDLEATKHRLTKEMHELRRKLREARLALPPSRFRLLKETDPEFAKDLLEGHLPSATERYDDLDEEGEGEEEEEEGSGGDERFERLLQMVQTMIGSGQRALQSGVGGSGHESGVPIRIQVLHKEDIDRS